MIKELEGLSKSFIKWFNKRPKVIQDAIVKMRPDKLYKIKFTGQYEPIFPYFKELAEVDNNDKQS